MAARIGIATGHVVVGELMGQDTAKERSVFGETPQSSRTPPSTGTTQSTDH